MFIVPALSSNNLPSEYTELEYIETTGKQHINTNINFFDSLNYKINLDVSFNKWYDYQGIFTNTTYSSLYESWITAKGTPSLRIGGQVYRSSVVLNKNTKYNFIYSNTGGSNNILNITHDGTIVDTLTSISSATTSDYPLVLFVSAGNTDSKAKWYRVSIEKNDVLMGNFIPARRNSDYVVGMYDTVSNTFFTNAGTGKFIAGPVLEIEIATTKYVETAFADSVSELNTTMGTIKDVVDNTIIQADRIGKLYTGKQNRPDDYNTNEKCPDNAICLLITESDGSLHWYPICNGDGSLFNISVFLAQLTSNGTSFYYHNNTTTYNELGGSGSAGTAQPSTDSIVRQLNETEWAVLWNDYGVVYGTSVCNGTYGPPNIANYTEQIETKGVGCWCKMTGVGDTDKIEHSVSGSPWVYYDTRGSSANCASTCAYNCAIHVRNGASWRSLIFTFNN